MKSNPIQDAESYEALRQIDQMEKRGDVVYTPGPRESSNVEDVRGVYPLVGDPLADFILDGVRYFQRP